MKIKSYFESIFFDLYGYQEIVYSFESIYVNCIGGSNFGEDELLEFVRGNVTLGHPGISPMWIADIRPSDAWYFTHTSILSWSLAFLGTGSIIPFDLILTESGRNPLELLRGIGTKLLFGQASRTGKRMLGGV